MGRDEEIVEDKMIDNPHKTKKVDWIGQRGL
jgi:hypothetical protein